MSESACKPPRVWTWEDANGGRFAGINRPTAGVRFEKPLPRGKHPFQLYSLATPNGVKVTVMFEELLAAGYPGAEYDAWLIRIQEGDQFGSGFVELNPNSKIPALLDTGVTPDQRVFESGNILLYLAGSVYTIADMATWPWYGALVLGHSYGNAAEFLGAESYRHLLRWARQIDERPAVARGRRVNRTWGEPHEQCPERHDARDLDA